MRRTEAPKSIWIKFGMVVDIPNVVTHTNFGDHWLRGFWVAGGQISPSPIDFHRRPYNTLALPCECVIPSQYVTSQLGQLSLLSLGIAKSSTSFVGGKGENVTSAGWQVTL